MRAFTQLCQKANFSLFNDAITIYPKPDGRTHTELMFDWSKSEQISVEVECFPQKVEKEVMRHTGELGIKRFVHHRDLDHGQYHLDGFSMDDFHIHVQFATTIDAPKLQKILNAFVKYGFLSQDENTSFIAAYAEANELEEARPRSASESRAKESVLSSDSRFFSPHTLISDTPPAAASAVPTEPSTSCPTPFL